MNQAVKEFLKENVLPEDLLWKEPMEKHTTFRVGGEAEVLIQIRDEEQLQKLVSYFGKVSQIHINLPYHLK